AREVEPRAPYFDRAEFDARLRAVRDGMSARGIDLLLVSVPENIFYLCGLDHWGYFAPHVLIVPQDGSLAIVTRAMERVTIDNQVHNASFEGHEDSETAADAVKRVLAGKKLKTVGLESWSSGLPHGLAQLLMRELSAASWVDASNLIDDIRMVKS